MSLSFHFLSVFEQAVLYLSPVRTDQVRNIQQGKNGKPIPLHLTDFHVSCLAGGGDSDPPGNVVGESEIAFGSEIPAETDTVIQSVHTVVESSGKIRIELYPSVIQKFVLEYLGMVKRMEPVERLYLLVILPGIKLDACLKCQYFFGSRVRTAGNLRIYQPGE